MKILLIVTIFLHCYSLAGTDTGLLGYGTWPHDGATDTIEVYLLDGRMEHIVIPKISGDWGKVYTINPNEEYMISVMDTSNEPASVVFSKRISSKLLKKGVNVERLMRANSGFFQVINLPRRYGKFKVFKLLDSGKDFDFLYFDQFTSGYHRSSWISVDSTGNYLLFSDSAYNADSMEPIGRIFTVDRIEQKMNEEAIRFDWENGKPVDVKLLRLAGEKNGSGLLKLLTK